MVARMGRPVAPGRVRCPNKAEHLSQTTATLSAEQKLWIPAKQRLDYPGRTGGGAENPAWREDQRGIAHPAGGAPVRGGIRRGDGSGGVGLPAHQSDLHAIFGCTRRAPGGPAAKPGGGAGATVLGGAGGGGPAG